VLRFAQEGAKILAVDRDLASAEETAVLAAKSGDECIAFQADVTREATLAAAMAAAVERWGRIDILHNNVGVSIAGGDKPLDDITESRSTACRRLTCAARSWLASTCFRSCGDSVRGRSLTSRR
jgi:NAD(P)-dependent dehydrogenase (short-subunit alcohol dehydrogenase family)